MSDSTYAVLFAMIIPIVLLARLHYKTKYDRDKLFWMGITYMTVVTIAKLITDPNFITFK